MSNISFTGPEPKIKPPKKRLKKSHYIDDQAEEDIEIEDIDSEESETTKAEKKKTGTPMTDDEIVALLMS
jgi:hypothetical protein